MTAAEVSSHDDSMPKIVISIIDVRLIGSDALFFNENERHLAEELARSENVLFIGLWVDAPLSVRAERVKKRLRNPSDVKDKTVLDSQLNIDTGKITWHKIMTDGPREKTIHRAIHILKREIRHWKQKHK